jgi:hypothetical protein
MMWGAVLLFSSLACEMLGKTTAALASAVFCKKERRLILVGIS